MSRWVSLAGVTLVLVLSVVFTALNGGQRVTLRLGVATLYRVPLTVVAFGALILGMVVMLVASIHSDLKVRRILRDRLAQEDRDEKARLFVDQNQQDLFDGAAEGGVAGASAAAVESPAPVEVQGELLYEARYDDAGPEREPTPSRPTEEPPARPGSGPPGEGEKPT